MTSLLPSPRVLTVTSPAIPQVAGAAALVPLKLSGHEAVNTLFEYTLILQSPDALQFAANDASNFPLHDMVGRELTCAIALDGHGSFVAGLAGNLGAANQGAGVRELSGLITAARHLGTDSRHALYALTLRPWLHLATLTSDCKVFQDQTPVDVIRAVLSDYAFATEVRLIETYPTRDYCAQYNETDFEFITRLMQEWGINYHFEHSGGVHRLILSDHNGAFSPLQKDQRDSAYHRIAYYPPGHKVDEEYIHAFTPTDRLTAGQYASREYDYTRPKVALGASQAQPRATGQANQEVYLWRGGKVRTGQAPGNESGIGSTASGSLPGSDYAQENKGADTAQANQTEPQGQHLARLRMQALRQAGQRASGAGHVRGIVTGHTFALHKHPQDAANIEYLTLSTYTVIENVSEDTARPITDRHSIPQALPTALSDAQRLSGQWRIDVRFEVQPTTELLRPEGIQPKPHTHGPETALVCGPEADTAQSDIYTDPLGRIKVQFPWDRYGAKNHNSSCWVRVSAAWAGNQLGAMHVPRIGQEVIVVFLGGDPDQPICTGRVYNQMNTPPWALPAQQALSGFRSRELKPGGGNSAAGRSNHLVLDDTEQKIQAQIKSDHQHSQLSLGHITRIEDNAGRKDHRGEGFELRTDGHGAIRAKDGLLISTEGRPNASGHITDLSETAARLTQGQSQHDSLGDLALQHQAQEASDQGDVAQAIADQNKAIAGGGKSTGTSTNTGEGQAKFPELQEPHLILSSPAGIESTTPQSTHQHSGQHHAITSGGHTSVSAGKSLLVSAKEAIRLFAYKAGMKLIAAGADVEIKSLSQNIHLLAKLDIAHTANRIEITAKEEVLMNGGGSYRRWSASGIEEGTSGSWVAHAANHSMLGAKSVGVNVNGLPHVDAHDETFLFKLPSGKSAPLLPHGVAGSATGYLAQSPDSGATAATHTRNAEPLKAQFIPAAVDVSPDASKDMAFTPNYSTPGERYGA
ncbi:type VI secretion system Vgr family protein [Limnohabitans sp. DM1]|uniref:type VI secretion system Vgr family protein n=1 Tax=Limnohabitans sp. DM1 TaxID=1597955 RepID=UPI000AB57A6B|nr:type VI secretion system Vgr family protein [Limnohabitans sp. DM1]